MKTKLTVEFLKKHINTDYKVAYPFGNETQIWNLKNFIYVKDKPTVNSGLRIIHKKLPISFYIFSNNCYECDQTKEATHG